MMKSIVLFLFLPIISNFALSQESQIQKIRSRYNDVTLDNFSCDSLTINSVLAAIGLQTTQLKFLFTAEQTQPEEDPYLMTYRLAKVTSSYNIAASMTYYSEYLYDEAENLVFYYRKASGIWEDRETRFYFNKGKLIKCMVSGTQETGDKIDYSDVSNFKSDDLSIAENVLADSKQYIKHFQFIHELEKLDK